MQEFEDDEGSSSEEDEEEDEEGALLTPSVEKSFFTVLPLIKKRDKSIYDKNKKFFPEYEEIVEEADTIKVFIDIPWFNTVNNFADHSHSHMRKTKKNQCIWRTMPAK